MSRRNLQVTVTLCVLWLALTAHCGNDELLLAPDTLPSPQTVEVLHQGTTNITLSWRPPLYSMTDLHIEGYAIAVNRSDDIRRSDYRQVVLWTFFGEHECTRMITGLQPGTEYRIYLSAFAFKNDVRLLSPPVTLTVYTLTEGIALITIIFPLAIISFIGLVGTVVYANVRPRRRLSTSEVYSY